MFVVFYFGSKPEKNAEQLRAGVGQTDLTLLFLVSAADLGSGNAAPCVPSKSAD